MHQTWSRGRGCLRVLRTGAVQGLHPIAHRAPHGLLKRMPDGADPRRPDRANDSATQRAKRAGQRVLLLRQRRTLRCRINRGLVYVAVAVLDSVYRRMRVGVDRVGHLARPRREKAYQSRGLILV